MLGLGLVEISILFLAFSGVVVYFTYLDIRKKNGVSVSQPGQVRPIGILRGLVLIAPGLWILLSYLPSERDRRSSLQDSNYALSESAEHELTIVGYGLSIVGLVVLVSGSRTRQR
jgi:hypothetical protein